MAKHERNPQQLAPLTYWISKGVVHYGLFCGTLVAALTDKINAQDFGQVHLLFSDTLILCLYLIFLYGFMGGLIGVAAYLTARAATRFTRFRPRDISFAFFWPLPLIISASLPDVGLLPAEPYEWFWHALSWPIQILILTALVLLSATISRYQPSSLSARFQFFDARVNRFKWMGICVLISVPVILGIHHRYLQYSFSNFPLDRGVKPPGLNVEINPQTTPPHKVVLIGVDGLDPVLIETLGKEGKIPALKKFMELGNFYSVNSPFPGVSPKKWPVISTGRSSHETGIHFFKEYRLPGMKTPFQRMPLETFTSLTAFEALNSIVPISRSLSCSYNLKAEPIWTTARQGGKTVTTLCWPNASPCGEEATVSNPNECPRSPSDISTEISSFHGSYPAALANPIDPIDFQEQLEGAKKVQDSIRKGEDLIMYALFSIDKYSHSDCKQNGSDGKVLTAILLLDHVLGKIMDHLTPEYSLVVFSDHGWDYNVCTHIHGRDSVLIEYDKNRSLQIKPIDTKAQLTDIAYLVKKILSL
jgi:hypothetical protein